MTHATLSQTNGSSVHLPQVWMQQTVQQFFNAINWENHPPEIQSLRLNSAKGESQPISLQLNVSQFFSTINWEGNAVVAPQPPPAPALPTSDAFTLESFSDLF